MFAIFDTITHFLLGLGVGLLAGMLGLGGGIVLVPALALVTNVPQHVAQGVSLIAIVPTAIVGAVAHRREGNLAPGIAISVGIVSVAAAILGASLSAMLDAELLRRAFGVLIIVVAVNMLRKR
jgi:uncharacterized membrane protein YfcA